MNKKYVLKGILLLLLNPLTLYNYFTTPRPEVTIGSFFTLALAIMLLYDEIIITRNKKNNRTKYQVLIDRALTVIFTVVSIDILFSVFANGISI